MGKDLFLKGFDKQLTGVKKDDEKKIWKAEDTTDDWKDNNIKEIRSRLTGWQLESFNESYEYKIQNGISLFKKKLLNE